MSSTVALAKADFATFLDLYKQRIDRFLQKQLEQTAAPAEELKAAILYSLSNGGKRVRPLIIYAVSEDLEIDLHVSDYLAASIECIHTYSLIHDDLPAMDNDDFRRGLPSCHKAHGEANAILAGDALQTLAFQQLLELVQFSEIKPQMILRLIKAVAEAAGLQGMTAGQALDLSTDVKDQKNINLIHQLKTAKLIQACCVLPGIIRNLDPYKLTDLAQAGELLGLAFQIQDDLADYESRQNTELNIVSHNGWENTLKQLEEIFRKMTQVITDMNGFIAYPRLQQLIEWLRQSRHYTA